MGPYWSSHHPHCEPFGGDVIRVGSRRYCIACHVGYPAIALGLATPWLLRTTLDLTALHWLAVGLVLLLPQALSFMGAIRRPAVQVAVKLALGVGIGLSLAGIWQMPISWLWKVLASLGGLMLLQSAWLLRLARLERTCRACPQYGRRPYCDGLGELQARVGHILDPAEIPEPNAGRP